MKVVFRVDASNYIGTGHVVRCLTLADELIKNEGIECIFICREHLGNMQSKITEHGFQTYMLPNNSELHEDEVFEDVGYIDWLGCDWKTDSNQTRDYLIGIKPEWLVLDHYALDKRWEESLSDDYKKLMVIDDLANRQHACDVLLDQNLFKNMSTRYIGKIPDHCKQLLGPEFALLQPNYSELRKQAVCRRLPIKRLMIFFGGIDTCNLTGLTLKALEEINVTFDRIDVVVSEQSPNYDLVKHQVQKLINVVLHSNLPSLAPLILKADLAIGAGGTASWERFCLGLPSLVVTVADNQREMNKGLHSMGLIRLVGDIDTINIDQISNAILSALSDVNIHMWSEKCTTICSGHGAEKVVNTILNI